MHTKLTSQTRWQRRARECQYRSHCPFHFLAAADYSLQRQKFGQWYIREEEDLVPAPPETHDPEQAQSLFTAALRSIRKEASNALHHPVEIATVTRPRHFNDSSKGAVIDAVMQIEPSIKQPWRVIDSVNAARLAYGLDSCAGLGLEENACDMEEGLHLVIFVEYNEKYLELTVAEVAEDTFGVDGQIRLHALGAAALDFRPSKDTHYQRVRDALQAFMADRHLTPDHYHKWSSLRAVVISGDAPESAIGDLLRWIPAVLGVHKDKIRNSIDPQYIGAVGAAHRGRHQVLTPGFFDDIDSSNIVPHDEL